MSKFLVFVATAVCAVTATIVIDNSPGVPEFAKKLTGQALVDYINSVQTGWTAKLNPNASRMHSLLMDMKYTELPADAVFLDTATISAAALPAGFYSRQKWPKCHSITRIGDQAQCGSCWAFAASEVASDRTCIASSQTRSPILSAEDILQCCTGDCGNGCKGGVPLYALRYWASNGLCTGGGFYDREGCKPYTIKPSMTANITGSDGFPSCQNYCPNSNYHTDYHSDKQHHAKTVYNIRQDQNAIKQEIMDHGPVVAVMTVYEDFFHYTGGVYQHTGGAQVGGHAIRISGWTVDRGLDAWVVANSWGTNWGISGFCNFIRGRNECGIEGGICAGEAYS